LLSRGWVCAVESTLIKIAPVSVRVLAAMAIVRFMVALRFAASPTEPQDFEKNSPTDGASRPALSARGRRWSPTPSRAAIEDECHADDPTEGIEPLRTTGVALALVADAPRRG